MDLKITVNGNTMDSPKKFILGVEGLTALVTGAAALVAIVSFLVIYLIVIDSKSILETASHSRAEFIAHSLGPRPSQIALESLVSSSIPGGGVAAVIILQDGFAVFAYPSLNPELIDKNDLITYNSTNGYQVSLLMEKSAVLGESSKILFLIGLFAAVLTIVAIMVPSFLRKSVLDPLKNILGEADKIEKGSGSSAISANISFQKLVHLIKEKDTLLDEMRLKALERAEAAESKSGEILEAMGSSIVVVDKFGKLLSWNDQALQLFQLNKATKSFTDHLKPYLHENLSEWDAEFNARIFRFKVTTGENSDLIILITDVTASVAIERKLVEESALADLGALSGGVAHEIGNTLCALEGFLALLARKTNTNPDRFEKILNEANIELDSAKKIVDSFRNLANQNRITKTLSCNEVVALITDNCNSKSIECKVESSMDLFINKIVLGDKVIYSRIMENLLSNAMRVCEKSEIEVFIGGSLNSQELIFRVQDRGTGLPDLPDEVFRPMYTTAEATGGMGLGLTITRRLINAMNGTIVAANREDRGAVFTVKIPFREINK